MSSFVSGMAKRRTGGFLTLGSHEVKERELEELNCGQPEAIIVGTGTDGAAYVAIKAQAWVKPNDASLLVEPSSNAIVKLNELVERKKKGAGLIDIAC